MLNCTDSFDAFAGVTSTLKCGKRSSVTISIVIPTFRRERLLELAVDSALQQKGFDDYEVLIVDNDPDGSEDILSMISQKKSSKIVYYKNDQNLGMFGNWNRGLLLASGRYVTILHDDDILYDRYLADMYEKFLVCDTSASGLYFCLSGVIDERVNKGIDAPSFFKNVNSYLQRRKDVYVLGVRSHAVKNQNYGTIGALFEREKAIELGGFSSSDYPISDYVFWCRWVGRYGAALKYSKELAAYRLSVNESMNPEVLEGFCKKGFLLRKEIIEKHELGKIYKLINRLMHIASTYRLHSYWGQLDDICKSRGVSRFVRCFIYNRFTYIMAMSFVSFFQYAILREDD